MKTEATPNEGPCHNCHDHTSLIRLSCYHDFCVKCLTFSYHKNKLNMNRVSQTRCTRCDRITELSNTQLKMINEFTDQVLVPLMKEEQERKNVKTTPQQSMSNYKQFKSHEQSIDKLTPIGGKGFYSKCQSPKVGMLHQNHCPYHPDQELNVVCLTCQNTVLCLSCTTGKKHASHAVKSLPKGMEAIYQQVALSKLKCRENQGVMEVLRRRIDDKRTMIEERWDKAKNTLNLHFDNLIQVITRKRQQINQSCTEQFQKQTAELMRDQNRINQSLKSIKRQAEKLNEVTKSNSTYVETIRRSTGLIQEVKEFKEPDLECSQFLGFYQWQGIIRDLDHICQRIEKIIPHSNFQYLGTTIKNSKSQQKLLKETQCKRTKTNIVSLNSSRDKRQKKYTKTEEDEKRNKSKANYKTESASKINKINKNYPTYLVQYIDKNNNFDSFAQNNPLTSSFKSTKLLSKSHLPGQQVKRKKQHTALIKQRLQRKTFNGTTKEHRQHTETCAMRKKKIPY